MATIYTVVSICSICVLQRRFCVTNRRVSGYAGITQRATYIPAPTPYPIPNPLVKPLVSRAVPLPWRYRLATPHLCAVFALAVALVVALADALPGALVVCISLLTVQFRSHLRNALRRNGLRRTSAVGVQRLAHRPAKKRRKYGFVGSPGAKLATPCGARVCERGTGVAMLPPSQRRQTRSLKRRKSPE